LRLQWELSLSINCSHTRWTLGNGRRINPHNGYPFVHLSPFLFSNRFSSRSKLLHLYRLSSYGFPRFIDRLFSLDFLPIKLVCKVEEILLVLSRNFGFKQVSISIDLINNFLLLIFLVFEAKHYWFWRNIVVFFILFMVV